MAAYLAVISAIPAQPEQNPSTAVGEAEIRLSKGLC